ncbi:MAG: xanthine dehydrogenase family protein subunit M [Syntrophobacteraceae bacterium]
MANAQFHKPADLTEACAVLSQYGARAKILAGGTDLMVAVNRQLLSPEVLVFIGNAGLDYIKTRGESLVLEAAVTHTEVARSALVRQKVPLLAQACGSIGSQAIRNVGTIGGNLVNASPAADAAVALMALGAELKLVSSKGERNVVVADFFTGPGQTALQPDELVKEIIVPIQKAGWEWRWYKLGQRKADVCGVVSVAVTVQRDNGTCSKALIALGAVAPTPLLARKAAAVLEGKRLEGSLIEEAAKVAAEETSPIDDVRATAWYRKKVSSVLVKRLLGEIAES